MLICARGQVSRIHHQMRSEAPDICSVVQRLLAFSGKARTSAIGRGRVKRRRRADCLKAISQIAP